MFNKIIDAGLEVYKPFADRNNETLTINRKWDDSTVNANTSRFFGSVTLNMYGGLARRPEVTAEGFALVMCHELGHAYGGTPYIQEWQKMSAEGQSDYYGAKECLQKVLPKVEMPSVTATSYTERRCKERGAIGTDVYNICIRQLDGSQSLGKLLAAIKKVPEPNFETPDTTVVTQTELSYPKTIQCRLDSYHNGTLLLDRPKCWFKN